MSDRVESRYRKSWVLPTVMAVVFATVAVVGRPALSQTAPRDGLCDREDQTQFRDVSEDHYAAAYILCARALGLSRGQPDGTYGPDDDLTRAHMAAFLARLWRDVLGKECPSGREPFRDVDDDHWAVAEIACLYNLGLTRGVTATAFRPSDRLTAFQMTQFVARLLVRHWAGYCEVAGGEQQDRAARCLVSRNIAPSLAEAMSERVVSRAQMAVYLVGAWYYVTGRGLPPEPPARPDATAMTPVAHQPRIAYTTKEGEMWVMSADGTGREQIIFNGKDPVWSPDRTGVAYRDGQRELWVVSTNGTGHVQLTADGENPVWSPDSTKIAYKLWDGGAWVANPDGTGQVQLAYKGGNPVWSPDGTKIAYAVHRDGVWVASLDGTDRVQLTDKGWHPVWSPDSTKIAYNPGGHAVWVVNADGTGIRQLAKDGENPVWSPDGTRIAYSIFYYPDNPEVVTPPDTAQLWVVNADGTGRRRLTQASWTGPVWSPRGIRIAYDTDIDGVWVANTDGTGNQQLTTDGYWPAWSSDGASITYTNADWELRTIDVPGVDQATTSRPDGDDAQWSPDSRRIPFYSEDGIWVTDADGSNPRQLTINDGSPYSPYFLPDRARIAYRIGEDGIGVINLDGSNRIHLIPSADTVDWSPDGTRAAYDTRPEGIWVVNMDGTDRRQLDAHGSWPDWSPDGTKILYYRDGGMWVMDADGGNPRQIDGKGYLEVWSPDSKKVAYHIYGDGVWVVNADGTGRKQLTTWGDKPAWSPDGTKIAFPSSEAFWVMDADGTNRKKLATEGGSDAVWSPDSAQIAYSSYSGPRVMNADGSDEQFTIDGERPVWSPDGVKIAYRSDSGLWVMNADGTDRTQLTTYPIRVHRFWWVPAAADQGG